MVVFYFNLIYSNQPTSLWTRNMPLMQDVQQIQIGEAVAAFLMIFGAHMHTLFLIKVKALYSINARIGPFIYVDY